MICAGIFNALEILAAGFSELRSSLFRFSIVCALCISLFVGWVPGRWMTVILTGLAGAVMLAGLHHEHLIGERQPEFFIILGGMIYLACAVALATPYAGRYFSQKRIAESGRSRG